MSDESKKIRIEVVHGGSMRDQQALMRNYFLATGVNDTYQFFHPSHELIKTTPPVVANDYTFQFELKEMPGVIWTISNFQISADSATGNWTNTHRIELDEGHFQAQAGPGAEASASTANA